MELGILLAKMILAVSNTILKTTHMRGGGILILWAYIFVFQFFSAFECRPKYSKSYFLFKIK